MTDAIKVDSAPAGLEEQDRWPWGLRLTFEDEQIEKIPSLLDLKAQDRLKIECEAHVVSTEAVEKQKDGKTAHRIVIQIEKIAVDPDKKPEEMNPRQYAEMRKGKEPTSSF